MKLYETKQIRNIGLFGHQGTGKTSLAESLLHVSGYLSKKGSIESKNTKSDYLPEEMNKQSSIQSSLIPVEWKGYKLNFIDLPGNDELVSDFYQTLNVIKGAVILIDATKGVEVGTEHVWKEISARNIPAVLLVNKMDKENVDFEKLLEDVRSKLGKKAVPFTYPIGREEDFEGFVNVVEMKARIYDGTQCVDAEIWEEKMPKVNKLNEMILESVAETSEELLDKYFGGEKLTDDEIKGGLRSGIFNGELMPVIVSSVIKNIGTETLLNMLIDFLPSPDELKELEYKDEKDGEIKRVRTIDSEPFSGYIFKSTTDPFQGISSYVKINSGKLKVGQDFYHHQTKSTFKVNHLYTTIGKELVTIEEAHAGDIIVLNKIDELKTGDSLCDQRERMVYEAVKYPTPIIYKALRPKDKADEDKISNALQRLNIEDPSFEIRRNAETGQLLIGGFGLSHIQNIVERMKNLYKVEIEYEDQKIQYRETIKKKVDSAEGKHKKQSGGAGQFGHVLIRFEPNQNGFEFHEEIFGGSVPKNYIPAVEKGLIETFERGPLAGFPVINVKATLFDGSYHSVDSNELSFKLAASLAFRNAIKDAQPTLLEPIMKIEVNVRENYVGDVMGDLNKRRGRILGMDQQGGNTVISAEVPEAEIVTYAIDLRALTQGGGRFTREFLRYEEVPNNLIEKIVEQYKKQ